MGRKSKDKKRHRQRIRQKAAAQQQPLADLLAEMDATAAQGRGRKALALAKLARRHPDFLPEEHGPRIVRGMEARIRELLGANLAREAADLHLSSCRENPQWAGFFSRDLLLDLDLAGQTTHVLAGYGDDPERTLETDRHVRERLFDIRPLALHAGLEDGHPLKREARLVLDGWREVEQEAAAAGGHYARMLRTVGRRSPLVDWRLFVQALCAFYDFEDDRATGALSRIPPESAVQPMAAILSDLIAGRDPVSPAGQEVERSVSAADLRQELSRVDDLLKNNRLAPARQKIESLLSGTVRWASEPGLFREIGARFMHRECLATTGGGRNHLRRFPDSDHMLLMAMGWDEADPGFLWEAFLDRRKKKLSDLEKALVYDRMALRTAQEDSDPLQPSGLMSFLEDDELEPADFSLAESLWDRSVRCRPLETTYRAWHAAARERGTREAEGVLERWHRDFPEAEGPLLALVESCRERGVYQKAMGFFKRLEAFSAGRPAVEAVRHYLLLDSAAGHIARRMGKKAALELCEVPDSARPCAVAVRDTLRWLLEERSPEHDAPAGGGAAGGSLAGLGQPVGVWLALETMRYRYPRNPWPGLPGALLPQSRDSDLVVRNFERLTREADPLWGLDMDAIPLGGFLITAFLQTGLPSSLLSRCLEFVVGKNGFEELTHERRRAVWPLTANGLRRRNRDLSGFLAYRALALSSAADASAAMQMPRFGASLSGRATACLRAAAVLATDRGEVGAVHLVEEIAGRALDLRLSDLTRKRLKGEEIQRIVAREAETVEEPIDQDPAGTGSRPGRGKRSRRKGHARPVQEELF